MKLDKGYLPVKKDSDFKLEWYFGWCSSVFYENGTFYMFASRCPVANRLYKGTIIPGTSVRYMGIRVENNDMDLGMGGGYFVFYTDKTKEKIYTEFAEMENIQR